MLFSSIVFLFTFLPISMLVYHIVPGRLKNIVLLISSLIFYAWGEPVYIILMLLSILFNFVSGLDIDRNRGNQRLAKKGLVRAVTVNLFILGFFKYYGFLVESLNAVLPFDIPYRRLALPIGISFYTFQTLSYIIDVYRGNVRVQRDLVNFGVYVTMFPQLIAGPIVKYADVERQLAQREITMEKFGEGTIFFVRGLAKKVLLANMTGMVFTKVSGLSFSEMSVLSAWIGCIAYTFQIYFDFGGYSDMAVGLGKMLGFDFQKNFDYPYMSKSVTEFWRRWHISLGTWFREYVYIPLGGNRKGTNRTICNLLVVWLLTGLWHGASWNFVLWGVYYGVLLIIEKFVVGARMERIPGVVRHLYCLVLVMVGWVFFFSPDIGFALRYLGVMFGIGAGAAADGMGMYLLSSNLVLFLIASAGCAPDVHELFQKAVYREKHARAWLSTLVYMAMFLLSVSYLVTETYNPFLYFRF